MTFREYLNEATHDIDKCFKGMDDDTVIVVKPNTYEVIGIFSDIKKSKKWKKHSATVDYDVVSEIILQSDDKSLDWSDGKNDTWFIFDRVLNISEAEFNKHKKQLCGSIKKFMKKYGVRDDFDTWTPDSKNQTYMKF